jgi:hypothetical protein
MSFQARTKKAMKLNPEVKTVSKDALAVMTKAIELFIGLMARHCGNTTSLRGAKSVRMNDLVHTVHSRTDFYQFLTLDFPKSMIQQPVPTASAISGSGDATSKPKPPKAPREKKVVAAAKIAKQQMPSAASGTTKNNLSKYFGSNSNQKSIGSDRAGATQVDEEPLEEAMELIDQEAEEEGEGDVILKKKRGFEEDEDDHGHREVEQEEPEQDKAENEEASEGIE